MQEGTFEALVVQYLAPSGNTRLCSVTLPQTVQRPYDELMSAGCHLTGEMLTTSEVSLTIEHLKGDVDVRIVSNGPGVKDAIVDLLQDWSITGFKQWEKNNSNES
jgi:hypothetical protein